MSKTIIRGYKFTDTDAKEPKITLEEMQEVAKTQFRFGNDNITRHGVYKIAGWLFDLRDCGIKQYVVKQHGGVQEYYAFNKTDLRSVISGKIDYILEVN